MLNLPVQGAPAPVKLETAPAAAAPLPVVGSPPQAPSMTAPQNVGKQANMDAVYDVIVNGDLRQLTKPQRLQYYQATCKSLGLNPLTKPLGFFEMSDKKVSLYATKEAAAQLARMYGVSVSLSPFDFKSENNMLIATARASTADGRFTEEAGAVTFSAQAKGDVAANAWMKLATKTKRRAILAHCGLGALDEDEVETVPGARKLNTDAFLEGAYDGQPKQVSDGAAGGGGAAGGVQRAVPVEGGASPQAAPAPVAPAGVAAPASGGKRARGKGAVTITAVEGTEVVTLEPGKPPVVEPLERITPQPLAAMIKPAEPVDIVIDENGDDVLAPAEVATGRATFRWEEKDDRDWLVAEMRRRWPTINKTVASQIAGAYKTAGYRDDIVADLDRIAKSVAKIEDYRAP